MPLNLMIDVFEGGEVCLGTNVVCDGFIDNLVDFPAQTDIMPVCGDSHFSASEEGGSYENQPLIHPRLADSCGAFHHRVARRLAGAD